MSCPDLNVLTALAEGGDAPPPVAEHLDRCQACRQELAALRVDLIASPEATAPETLALWKALVLGAAAPARPFSKALPWAAAILLAAGLWAFMRPDRPATAPGIPAPAVTHAPAWLLEEGATWAPPAEIRPFVLGGAALGAAAPGTRLKAEGTSLTLERGSLFLEPPPGLLCRVLGPGGAAIQTLGAAVWAEAGKPEKTAWSLLSEAHAEASPAFRVWAGSGALIFWDAGGKVTPMKGPVLAECREGAWSFLPGRAPPAAMEGLKAAAKPSDLASWSQAPQADGGWGLDGRQAQARLQAAGAPAEGLLRVRLARPAREAEVLLAFPQVTGGRAWGLGDWGSRGFGESVTLSVAFGPWGARGYVDGKRVWSMDAARLAETLGAAPAGMDLGVAVSGGELHLEEARILWQTP